MISWFDSLLAFYLLGVVSMLAIVLYLNRNVKRENIKGRAVLKSLLACLGSWITLIIFTIKEID